ncbi:MAG: hypothetical protein C5B50_00715 [Verrucomicrobia bacterium]|nr:MAG: hypothetical protein C5B50_00715 [Verrucomicrobiota bacterium]
MGDVLAGLLGTMEVHLYSGRELEPSDGPNNHPDPRMHLMLGDMRALHGKPEGWQEMKLVRS